MILRNISSGHPVFSSSSSRVRSKRRRPPTATSPIPFQRSKNPIYYRSYSAFRILCTRPPPTKETTQPAPHLPSKYPSRDKPATPKKVWNMSARFPGLSAMPPSSASWHRRMKPFSRDPSIQSTFGLAQRRAGRTREGRGRAARINVFFLRLTSFVG